MMNKIFSIITIALAISFVSCETDIDVNAEYQDITVVYAAINPTDTNHYIKINKAFLGNTSALDLAEDASNFNYEADEISVVVQEIDEQNQIVKTHNVVRTVNEIPKDAGIFDNSENVLYKFVEPAINRYNKFKVVINNSSLNKEIYAETEIVKEITVGHPTNTKFQFWIGDVATGNPTTKEIKITTGEDIGRAEGVLVFNYIEHYTTASGLPSVEKSFEMVLGETRTTTVEGAESIGWTLKGETFFSNVESKVPLASLNPDLSHRELDNISLKFNIAGTELSTFMDVSAPSNTVNQEKPNYTNLTNGIGIFSSREQILWESTIDPQTQNQVNIQNATISMLESLDRGFCFGTTGTGFPVAPCVQQ